MNKPLVSVIMGIYNTAESLPASIESLINQTYTNWELIMCDDCSTDNTYEVALEYANKYDNIKVVKNEENKKLAYSLNHCLKYAQGEYIARMDADDICLPQRFEKQVKFLEDNTHLSVVGTSMTRFNENGDFADMLAIENPNKYNLKNTVPYFHATIMMRKKAMDKIGGYTVEKRTERGQDLDLWFKFYANGFEGGNILECLYKVREDKNALKRRKLKYSVSVFKTMNMGYKMLKFPFWWRIYTIKPIVSHFTPYKLKVWRRNRLQAKRLKNANK